VEQRFQRCVRGSTLTAALAAAEPPQFGILNPVRMIWWFLIVLVAAGAVGRFVLHPEEKIGIRIVKIRSMSRSRLLTTAIRLMVEPPCLFFSLLNDELGEVVRLQRKTNRQADEVRLIPH
jgi:hypothetical protein